MKLIQVVMWYWKGENVTMIDHAQPWIWYTRSPGICMNEWMIDSTWERRDPFMQTQTHVSHIWLSCCHKWLGFDKWNYHTRLCDVFTTLKSTFSFWFLWPIFQKHTHLRGYNVETVLFDSWQFLVWGCLLTFSHFQYNNIPQPNLYHHHHYI